jgi:hypothetical protein
VGSPFHKATKSILPKPLARYEGFCKMKGFCKMGSIHEIFLTSLGLIWGTAQCQRLVSKAKACQQRLGCAVVCE